jgi:hypothetical protein
MAIVLTERMKGWIELMGCHLCVATPEGVPWVTVSRFAKVTKPDQISFAMEKGEIGVIEAALSKNPWGGNWCIQAGRYPCGIPV